jgi:hypothetical protein
MLKSKRKSKVCRSALLRPNSMTVPPPGDLPDDSIPTFHILPQWSCLKLSRDWVI